MEVLTEAIVLSSLSGSLLPMLAVRLACGSESMSKTLFPALASPIPKFTVVVVFAQLCKALHNVGYGKLNIM